MTSVLPITILLAHYILVALLCIYGAHRLYYTFAVRKAGRSNQDSEPAARDMSMDERFGYPFVTVQAPVFNERFVVERLIDAMAALRWPRNKLQIQIIDDSTDDSVGIAAARIAYHRSRGVNIVHVCRGDRKGYKAGALQAAMASADGEYIAIFDADFMPHADFLERTVPEFGDPTVGMVQTRWRYLNRNSNLLTRVQAIILDAHFGLEQVVRHASGAFFNFNGTAGIWRRKTIESAGGWRADTLTEDLDLSYRAQMKGWKFVYREDIDCPSELPIDMTAFKTQQHRWAKGAIEVMKKMLGSLWKSDAPTHAKVEATFHLTANFSYLVMLVDAVLLALPAIYIRTRIDAPLLAWLDIPLFFFASVSHALFFLSSQKRLYGAVRESLSVLPVLLATSIGLSVNNGRAVVEAVSGYVTGFVRTPKTGDQETKSAAANTLSTRKPSLSYKALSARWADGLEIGIAALYLGFLLWAITVGHFVVVPFLALFAAGFFFTGYSSIHARWRGKRPIA